MRSLAVAAAARADLAAISEYTEQLWGMVQKRRYMAAIRTGFRQLRRDPKLGRRRNDLAPSVHSMQIGRHVIFYRFDDDTCHILRVLHDRMDSHRHLGAVDPK